MYFSLEDTPAKKSKFNRDSNQKFGWLETLPWHLFGIDASDGIDFQEILNLQNAAGCEADGLVGISTLRQVQQTLKRNHGVLWNPCTGATSPCSIEVPIMFWHGLEVPLNRCTYPVHTYKDPAGVDLHFTGNFSKKSRSVNSLVVHWGGLNPQHLGRVFANRKASSHIAIGRSEDTGEVGIYQYIDLAHVTWHAKGANENSIGIDICQQPELKHLGYYVGRGYLVETIENPSYPKYGPKKIISLDSEIRRAAADLLTSLQDAFSVPSFAPSMGEGCLSPDQIARGGIFSHFHVDLKGQGKWDVAPWWDGILEEQSTLNLGES